MLIWMQIFLSVVGATVVIVPLLMWFKSRARRRHESWRCPQCCAAFGVQHELRFWTVRRDPHIAGAPTGGPVLRCSACQRDFEFDADGRQVDEHREYVHRESQTGAA